MCAATASMSFCLSRPGLMVTSRSRSPTVSLPRRSDPAGVTDSTASPTFGNVGAQLLRFVIRHIKPHPSRAGQVLELLGGLQDVLLALFAEARQVAQLAFARQLFDALDRPDFEVAPEKRDFLRSQRLQLQQVEQRRRIFLQQLLAQAVVAGLENFVDVLGHAVADAGQFLELFRILGDIFDALVDAVEQLGDFFVAAVAADDRAVDFQQLRRLAQDSGDFPIFHDGRL